MRACLDEGRVRSEEGVGELVGGVGLVEEGVDVVVLNEVAAAGAEEVDGARVDGISLASPHHARHLALPLLVVVELLRQWDCSLQQSQKIHTSSKNQH